MLHDKFLMQCVPCKNLLDSNKLTYCDNFGVLSSTWCNVTGRLTGSVSYAITAVPSGNNIALAITISGLQANTNYALAFTLEATAEAPLILVMRDVIWGAGTGTNTITSGLRFNTGVSTTVVIGLYHGSGTLHIGDTVTISNLQLEVGSVVTAIEPFRYVF